MDQINHSKYFPRKLRRLTALLLSLLFVLSLAGCGKKEENTAKVVGSIFELFDDGEDPFAEANTGSQGHTGDYVVDPPITEDTTLNTQDTTESTESTESTEDQPVPDDNTYASVENEEFNQLQLEFLRESMENTGTMSFRSYIKNPDSYGVKPPEQPTWGDYSATMQDAIDENEKWIARLEAIDVNTLTEQQRFDYDYFLDNLVTARVSYDNYQLTSAFSLQGLQTNLPTIFTDYIFTSKKDVEDYISCMLLLPDYIDACIEEEQKRVDAGYCLEDGTIDKVIKQCDDVLAPSLDEHFMVGNFDEAMDGLDFLTASEKEEYKAMNKDAVKTAFLPCYESMKAALQSWKGKNKVPGGLCNQGEGGKALYNYMLREYTGSSKTPQEMIDYLENKLKELDSKASAMYKENQDAYLYYYMNKDNLFDYLKDEDTVTLMNHLWDNAMSEFPKTDPISFDVQYFSKSMETVKAQTQAYYTIPAYDDTETNLIRVNGINKDDMWVTLAHEGLPGHMYQTNYYRRTNPSIARITGFELGYVEGWAVYASYESLKYCDFNGSPYAEELAQLYRYDAEKLYIYHGLIDLGIHYQGWDVEGVRNFLLTHGLNTGAAENLYYTLVSDPAVYLSYSMGYHEMQDMRIYAENQLGSKFDVVEYHKAVLEAGPCKYDQLKKKIDKYILEHK